MAQPQQQQQQPYLPRPFSPPRSTPSPGANPSGVFLPPSKRQRLSPNPLSPYSSPNIANISLPNFNLPQPQNTQSSTSPTGSNGVQNMAAPQPAPGTMGPPSRPVEKATDMTELADVLVSSGVDLKEEEAALTNPYLSSAPQSASNVNNVPSFHSTLPANSNIGTLSSNHHINYLSQNVPGNKGTFYGGGTFNQPAMPYQAPEALAEEQRKKATRRLAERRQYHLNDPFLLTGSINRKLIARAEANHARLPMEGIYSPARNTSQPIAPVEITAPDGTTVIATKGQSFVYPDAPMVDIFALVSLATEERIRGLVEDACAIAQGRRTGSHGVVPPEWADLAVASGQEPTSGTFTPGQGGWESAVSPKTNPLKRSYSSANKLPTPVSDHTKSPIPSTTFSNITAQALRNISQAERVAEEARLAKRARRAASSTNAGVPLGDANSQRTTSSTPAGTPGSATPTNGLLGERAPDVKPTSKKAARKEAEAKATEAQQHQNTNATVTMALGGGGAAKNLFGKKKGGYSWLEKKPNATGGFPVPGKINTAVNRAEGGGGTSGVGAGAGGSAVNGTYLPPGGKRIGEWREDRERGAGIQLRDLINVLEADGREKRVLARLYGKLNSKD